MGLFDQLTGCKGCSHSDPTQDTVQVNPALLGKENVAPIPATSLSKSNIAQEKEAERLKKEEDFRKALEQKRQAAIEAGEEKRRVQEEARKKKEEEAARAHAEALAIEAAERAAKEEKQRLAEEQAEAARQAQAAAEAAEAFRLAQEAELHEAQEKVKAWCKTNGYADMLTPKKKLLGGSKFALHTAVKQKNLEMVCALVKCGVDKAAKDSKGQTAYDLAIHSDKNGSMTEFFAALA